MRYLVAPFILCVFSVCTSALAETDLSSVPPLRVMTFNIRYGTANDGSNAWIERRSQLIEVIHDFSFALIVGVLVGTYSSIYIASPVLLLGGKGEAAARSSIKQG